VFIRARLATLFEALAIHPSTYGPTSLSRVPMAIPLTETSALGQSVENQYHLAPQQKIARIKPSRDYFLYEAERSFG
jgi:hypothetical protein